MICIHVYICIQIVLANDESMFKPRGIYSPSFQGMEAEFLDEGMGCEDTQKDQLVVK